MEMQQVRYFVALAQTLNFTRAAEACNVTQPVLTRAIKALEAEFGGDLIRREGRATQLTDLGNQMLPLLRQCYESALSAKSVARSVASGEISDLSLGLSRTVDLVVIQSVLIEIFKSVPRLRLKLRRGSGVQLLEALKSGDIELAVAGPIETDWDRLDRWPMFVESFDLLVGSDHAIASRNTPAIDIGALSELTFLIQAGNEIEGDMARRLGEIGISLDRAHEVDTDQDLAELVCANVGIAVTPASTLRASNFRRYSLPEVDLRRTVAIYAVAGRARSPAASTMLNLVRSADWVSRLSLPLPS